MGYYPDNTVGTYRFENGFETVPKELEASLRKKFNDIYWNAADYYGVALNIDGTISSYLKNGISYEYVEDFFFNDVADDKKADVEELISIMAENDIYLSISYTEAFMEIDEIGTGGLKLVVSSDGGFKVEDVWYEDIGATRDNMIYYFDAYEYDYENFINQLTEEEGVDLKDLDDEVYEWYQGQVWYYELDGLVDQFLFEVNSEYGEFYGKIEIQNKGE